VVGDRSRVKRRWVVGTHDRGDGDRTLVLIVRYDAGRPTISSSTWAAVVRASAGAAGLEPPKAARPPAHDGAPASTHASTALPARSHGVTDEHRSLPGHVWHHRPQRRQHRRGRQRR
jgi:hypothetical protein